MRTRRNEIAVQEKRQPGDLITSSGRSSLLGLLSGCAEVVAGQVADHAEPEDETDHVHDGGPQPGKEIGARTALVNGKENGTQDHPHDGEEREKEYVDNDDVESLFLRKGP